MLNADLKPKRLMDHPDFHVVNLTNGTQSPNEEQQEGDIPTTTIPATLELRFCGCPTTADFCMKTGKRHECDCPKGASYCMKTGKPHDNYPSGASQADAFDC